MSSIGVPPRQPQGKSPFTQLAPFFDRTCEEAREFYAEVLGKRISEIARFAGSSICENMPPEHRDRIMHTTFVAGMTLSLSDGGDGQGEMPHASPSQPPTAVKVRACSSSFRLLVDRFGIRWMVMPDNPAGRVSTGRLIAMLSTVVVAASSIAHIHGRVVSIDERRGTFFIHHDPFAAMPMAMTMEVEPKRRADLRKLHVGETIDATIDTSIAPWPASEIHPASSPHSATHRREL